MPLFQIGYRRYEGERTSDALHWWPITRTGLAIAWRSKLLRRLVFASFLPFLYFGLVFFIIGRVTDPAADPNSPFFQFAQEMLGRRLVNQLHENPSLIRSAAWTMVFSSFGTSFQLIMAALVGAVVGPPLISSDLRTRAFLIYFSRPISRLDYVLGKAAILVSVLAMVTLLPSLLLYALSILFSPSFDTLLQTLPVAGSIVLANLGTIVPVGLVLLMFSSLTRQPRFATIAWFVVCLFGPLTHLALQNTPALRNNGWTFLLSPIHTLQAFQLGLYDMQGRAGQLALQGDMQNMIEGLTPSNSPLRAAIWLALISIGCLYMLLRRVDSPTRI